MTFTKELWAAMEPIYTDAENVEIHGKVVLAVRRT